MPEQVSINQIVKEKPFWDEIQAAREEQKYFQFLIETELTNKKIGKYADKLTGACFPEDNPLMDWLKSMFNIKNYRQLSKWIRHPLPTVKVVQNDILPELEKVFESQNPNFDYDFTTPNIKSDALEYYAKIKGDEFYRKEFFHEYIYRYNSIQVTDLRDTNEPYWFFVDINSLEAIDFTVDDKIKLIHFKEKRKIEHNGRKYKEIDYLYDETSYRAYVLEDDKYIEILNNPHVLGRCPAFFIADRKNSNQRVPRKNIISNFQHDLERLIVFSSVFDRLKLFGGVPVASHWNMKTKPCGKKWGNYECKDGHVFDNSLGAYSVIGNVIQTCSCRESSAIEAGSVASLTVTQDQLNSPNAKFVDLNANFLKWHFIPEAILKWWNDFVQEFPFNEIISSLTGIPDSDNGTPKNQDQIRSMRDRLRNTLVSLSSDLSMRRTTGDTMLFVLRYGHSKVVNIHADYGTDFYLETEEEIRKMLNESQNQLQRQNFSDRLNMMMFKNNKREMIRQKALRMLMPYVDTVDADFYNLTNVSVQDMELRTNFNKYISDFEGRFGKLDTVILSMGDISFTQSVQTIYNQLINKIIINGSQGVSREGST